MIKFNLKVLIAQYEVRTGERLSYRELSRLTGINKNSINAIAANQARRLDLDTLERLCDFFECEPGDLIVKIDSVRSEVQDSPGRL